MTELTEALFASLLTQRRNQHNRQGTIFAPLGYHNDDLRAARERARKR